MEKRRKLPLFAALVTLAAVVAALVASNAFATDTAHVKQSTLDDKQGACDGSITLWHFVITQIGDDAPASIHVFWDTPAEEDVPLLKVSGGTAHYETALHPGDLVTDATAVVPDDWDGEFNLSHITCNDKFLPEISTEASGEGKTGDKLYDTAFLTGGSTDPVMGGSVTFNLYFLGDDPNCESPIYTDEVDVTGEADGTAEVDSTDNGDPTDGNIATKPGSYTWIASYSGDDNNEPAGPNDCGELAETSVITAGASTVVTEIRDGEDNPVLVVDLGSTVHDHATVTSDNPNFIPPEGTVDFNFYKSTDPEESPCEGDLVDSDLLVDLDTNGEADSKDFGPLGAGTYGFLVDYNSSDTDKWTDSTGVCEPLTVNKGDLTIVTNIHNETHGVVTSVPNTMKVHDTATLTGVDGIAPDPTKVQFAFWNTIDCTGDGVGVANTGLDSSSGDPRSAEIGPFAPGSYSFRARFAGDDNYNPLPGGSVACEPLTVSSQLGKTMGFWGNTNGQALLPTNPGVTLGIVNGTCYIVVDTKAKSKTILPNTKNGVTILTNCTTAASRDPNLNTDSINTLLAQQLALSFNILYVKPPTFPGTYAGQTIAGLGCTGSIGSTGFAGTDTVETVRNSVNTLIGNIKSGGTVVTQPQIGALNTLLGCLNREV